MHILQCGYEKSGNYWLWKILSATLDAAGVERRSFVKNDPIYSVASKWELSFGEQADVDMIDWRMEGSPPVSNCRWGIPPMFSRRIEKLAEYVDATSLVWSHSAYGPAADEALSCFDKVIYLIRDPRDIILSYADFVTTAFHVREYGSSYAGLSQDERIRALARTHPGRWKEHVAGWLSHYTEQSFHCVFYEQLVADFETEYRRLLNYLDIELGQMAADKVRQQTAMSTLRKVDAGHVNKGICGRWQSEMPDDCARQITVECYEMLGLLGYSQMNGEAYSSPALPDNMESAAIRACARG